MWALYQAGSAGGKGGESEKRILHFYLKERKGSKDTKKFKKNL
jgi:hypothetical protein